MLGERLGQAVRQRLHHDRRVVVAGLLVASGQVLGAVDGDRETAQVIVGRGQEIGQAAVRAAVGLGRLLPQHRQPVAVDDDVVALGARGPEAVAAARREQAIGDDLIEQRVGVVEQLAGLRVVQDRRVLAL